MSRYLTLVTLGLLLSIPVYPGPFGKDLNTGEDLNFYGLSEQEVVHAPSQKKIFCDVSYFLRDGVYGLGKVDFLNPAEHGKLESITSCVEKSKLPKAVQAYCKGADSKVSCYASKTGNTEEASQICIVDPSITTKQYENGRYAHYPHVSAVYIHNARHPDARYRPDKLYEFGDKCKVSKVTRFPTPGFPSYRNERTRETCVHFYKTMMRGGSTSSADNQRKNSQDPQYHEGDPVIPDGKDGDFERNKFNPEFCSRKTSAWDLFRASNTIQECHEDFPSLTNELDAGVYDGSALGTKAKSRAALAQ